MSYFNIGVITALLFGAYFTQTNGMKEEIDIYAVEGKNLNLEIIAETGKAIQFCRWDAINNSKIGPKGLTFVDEESLKDNRTFTVYRERDLPNAPGYSYFGSGLFNGTCGITIEKVTDLDITRWTCLYIEYDKNEANPQPETKNRFFIVTKSIAPEFPKILDTVRNKASQLVDDYGRSNLTNSDTLTMECCAENGIPHPSLSIFLEEIPIEEAFISRNESSIICIKTNNLRFTRRDNGKTLRCIADHSETSSIQEDSVQLTVYYPPQLITVPVIPENNTFVVNGFEFYATTLKYLSNPVSLLSLKVKNHGGLFEEISEDFAEYILVMNGNHDEQEVVVKTRPTGNETTTIYRLTIQNSYGSEDIYIEHHCNCEQTEKDPPKPDEPGFPIYWLLYPLIGFVCIVIIVSFIICCAKQNGWWCYKHRRGEYKTAPTSAKDFQDSSL